ncbi:MAG TPA: orotate phosphoribosyltransferase [Bacteroidota bacterium]|nr:orotate phosphoribosyltransferase [Bacteroidota bacterium]
MQHDHILSIFRDSEALLEGHFQLTSGLHSDRYFQCARVLQYPHYAELLCGELAQAFRPSGIQVVVAPALGGIVVGQETGRQLRARTLFAERKEGVMQLRRGFQITPGENVLVCEDVVTTGGSVSEVISLVRQRGGKIAGVAYIVDRSGVKVRFDLDPGGVQCSLVAMDVVAYAPEQCPLCAKGIPVLKPGSRGNS